MGCTRVRRLRSAAVLIFFLLSLLGAPFPVGAVEYRLRVVSLYQEAFSALLRAGELADGASGPGLDRLEATLDGGTLSLGAVLWDRPPQAVAAEIARAYGAVPARPDVPEAVERLRAWNELRWDGRPGERTVWKVSPSGLRVGELERVALRGRGPLRQFLPFTAVRGDRSPALSVPLLYLWAHEDRGTIWSGYLSGVLDLAHGIAAVVGVNANRSIPDQVYLIVRHEDVPTTYKAVLSWRPRDRSHLNDLEAPDADQMR
ncbi:MAG TPA: hypothetical protein VNO23_00520 [Candidatus Binatia bacterium]|jgi:hypothetical protein|nr:hypothetical protein [Candidatus Binatia bacterium]